jgi:large-conductance mechanosensitive channel
MFPPQVADILTPLIAAIYGGSDFSALTFTVHNSKFLIGDFINNVRLRQPLGAILHSHMRYSRFALALASFLDVCMATHAVCMPVQVITFIVVALVIYFCVVMPVQAAMNKYYVRPPQPHILHALMPPCMAGWQVPATPCMLSSSPHDDVLW